MTKASLVQATLLTIVVLISGCGKPKEEPVAAPRFDAKVIAAEADKGNLAPLTELNKACTDEVQQNGRRMAVCGIQDQVGKLTKPLSVRF